MNALLFLHRVDQFFKFGFIQTHDDIAEHLNKTTIGIISETLVVRLCFNDFNNRVVHTEIENGVHHTRHGSPRAGTYGYQKRILRIPQLLARRSLQPRDILVDLFLNFRCNLLTIVVVANARFRRDGKSGRNRHAQVAHLGKVRSLAAKQLTHRSISFRKLVDILFNSHTASLLKCQQRNFNG